MYVEDVDDMLRTSGVPDEKINTFNDACDREFGESAVLNPGNLIETKKLEMVTPGVKITVDPEYTYLITTQEIDGSQYLLDPGRGRCYGQRDRYQCRRWRGRTGRSLNSIRNITPGGAFAGNFAESAESPGGRERFVLQNGSISVVTLIVSNFTCGSVGRHSDGDSAAGGSITRRK